MKKLLLILVLCTAPALAQNYFSIDWAEFCPQRYVNINTSKHYKTKPAQYWAERKRQFNERVNYCNMQEDKESCFNELRVYENNKTQLYYSELNSNLNKMNLIKSF